MSCALAELLEDSLAGIGAEYGSEIGEGSVTGGVEISDGFLRGMVFGCWEWHGGLRLGSGQFLELGDALCAAEFLDGAGSLLGLRGLLRLGA